MSELDELRPVWLEVGPGFALRGWDTGRRKWFGWKALVIYVDFDRGVSASWVLTSDLLGRGAA